MRRFSFLLIVSMVLFTCMRQPLVSFAQGVTSPAPGTDVSSIKDQYKKSLDLYRIKEDDFSVAASEYYTLHTLTAQEDAVKAAREVMISRVDTIIIYLQALQTTLNTNQGIEITRKNALITQLLLVLETLKRHRANVEIATDRITIETEATFFENQQSIITSVCYQALSLIKIGAIQAAADQLAVVQQNIDSFIATANISETIRAEKKRGSDEITRTISSITDIITQAQLTYDNAVRSSNSTTFDNGTFHSIQTQLSPAYAILTQSLEYAKELVQ